MRLNDTEIFFDEQGNTLLKVGGGVELGTEHHLLAIETPCIIMRNCTIEARNIGAYTVIGQNTQIAQNVKVGRYSTIGERCYIGEDRGSDFLLSNVLRCPEIWNFDGNNKEQKRNIKLNDVTLIGNDVKIGNNVIVKKGVSIGDGAIIQENSVVENDVLPYAVAGGNPAAIKYYRFSKSTIEQIMALHWWDYNIKIFEGLSEDVDIEKMYRTIQNNQENRIDLHQTLFYINEQKRQITREQGENKIVIYEEKYAGEKMKGGISRGSFYDSFFKILHIEGWLLPSRAYDEVEIYLGDGFLGKAELHILRKDVFRDYPEYGESRSGFVFDKEMEIDEAEIKITAIIRKQGNIVTKKSDIIKSATETLWNNGRMEYENLKKTASTMRCKIVDLIKRIRKIDGRKILVCYGNCQVNSIVSLIMSSDKLKEIYMILYFQPVQLTAKEECKNGFPDEVMKEIDCFIYQNIARDNKYSERLASMELVEMLRDDAVRVCIPNVYWTGYFPQFYKNKNNRQLQGIRGGAFPYGDKNIQQLWKDYNAEEIAFMLSREDFYSQEDVKNNAAQSLQELRNRESECDIKISDFIESKYKEHYLFYTTNHPTNYLLKELVIRIFAYLNINVTDIDEEKAIKNDAREIAIYPSVKKHLGLTFKKDKFCWLTLIKNEPISFQDYIIDYISYCKPEAEEEILG